MGSEEKKPRTKLVQIGRRTNQEDKELASLLDIGAALSAEHETHKVLNLILEKATENTNADGGSIYLVERTKKLNVVGEKQTFTTKLRFSHSLNMSVNSESSLKEKLIDINDESIAGYVALTGKSVRLRDAYVLSPDTPFKFNSELDHIQKYRTKSVLSVPIRTNKGRILGVVQLVNKRKPSRRTEDEVSQVTGTRRVAEREIIAFSDHDDKLMHAFASHAAVALENAKLTEDIGNLFESFVKASVMAIEARDPSTSGHSDRVAAMTVKLAEVTDGLNSGLFKDVRFSIDQIREIRYASLLHDFGKIGVREAILVKARKLFPHELETILLRLSTIGAINEAQIWRDCAEQMGRLILEKNIVSPAEWLSKSLWTVDSFNKKVDQIRKGILKANESQIIDKDFDINSLMEEIKRTSQDIGQKILDEGEIVKLSVKRGTLSPQERAQIESHVSHTYDFLSQIAWTDQLQNVPDIAHAHHEKLDGTGYPRHIKGELIPIQSRMMTISDIYDALTAFDRPYKKAVDTTRAIDILHDEANDGKLDKELLKIFIEARVFEVVAPTKNKKVA